MAALKGFPQSDGGKIESIIEKTGPASYTQVTTGSPPTGGQSVTAAEFGMKSIDFIEACMSDDGQFIAFASPAIAGVSPSATWVLLWMVSHTGLEVAGAVNLSARTIRLRAIGM
jgi:hypothetical protein